MKRTFSLLALGWLVGCGQPDPSGTDASANPVVDAGPGTDAGDGPDASTPADAGSDAGQANDAGTDAGTKPDAGQDAGTDAGTKPDAGQDAGSVTDAGWDAGTKPDAGQDAGTDAGTKPDAGQDAGSVTDAGWDAGTGVELNPGWVGGACTTPADCSNAAFSLTPACVTAGFPAGMCTQACTSSGTSYVCPDAAATGPGTSNTITRCINANGSPNCVAECDFMQSPTGCRPGYTCVERQRYNQPSKIFKVCLPSAGQRWPGEPAPVNDIGAACAVNQDCAQNACLSLTNGYCTKLMCGTAGCPSGSSCFVMDAAGTTACLKNCAVTGDCRSAEGYVCDADSTCWPTSTPSTWNQTVGAGDCTAAWGVAGNGLSPCDTVKDHYVVVHKSARNLALCNAGALVANYQAGLGFAPVGDKVQEGDGKTPEGVFYVADTNPNSSYYKSFLVSYPDKGDATRGLAAGLISAAEKTAIDTAQNNCTQPPQTTALGSWIMIHGSGGTSDWTWGCVALNNSGIDALWPPTLNPGDTIVILP
jgi:hypothetical protein